MEEKINIRVSEELKNKMKDYKKEKSIDWSALIRKFIEQTIEEGKAI